MLRHSHPWAYFLRKLHFKKTCAPDINFSAACKTQDIQGTIMSIDRKMDKDDAVLIYEGILLSHKKEGKNAICSNTDDLARITGSEQSQESKYPMPSLIKQCYNSFRKQNRVLENPLCVSP